MMSYCSSEIHILTTLWVLLELCGGCTLGVNYGEVCKTMKADIFMTQAILVLLISFWITEARSTIPR